MNDGTRLGQARASIAKELAGFYRELSEQQPEIDRRFKLSNVLFAMRNGGLRSHNGYEGELCAAAALACGLRHDPNRVRIPFAALGVFRRDLTAGSAGAGGYLVDTGRADAVDVLRPWSVVARAGLTMVEGISDGEQVVPQAAGTVTTQWQGFENAPLPESTPAFDAAFSTPKTGGAYVEMSRTFRLQTGAAGEEILRREFLRSIGTMIDKAVIDGQGASQPLGILGTSGIGSQSGASIDHDGTVDAIEALQLANVDDAYVKALAAPGVRKILAKREVSAGSGRYLWDGGRLAGVGAFVSTDMPASTLLLGDFSSAALLMWGGGIRIEINPYANFPAGIVGMRAVVDCDLVVLHPTAFRKITSVS